MLDSVLSGGVSGPGCTAYSWLSGVATAAPPLNLDRTPYYSSRATINQYLNSSLYPPNSPTRGLAGSVMPFEGVFPARARLLRSSAAQTFSPVSVQYSPIGRAFCMSPTFGPQSGGTLLRVMSDVWAAGVASGNLSLVFGGTVRVPARYNHTLNMIEALSPPCTTANVSVRVVLTSDGLVIGHNSLLFAYYPNSHSAVSIPSRLESLVHHQRFCAASPHDFDLIFWWFLMAADGDLHRLCGAFHSLQRCILRARLRSGVCRRRDT
jgi:hypothetical protein